MAHDVFISYSSKDRAIADPVCAMLEAECIRCWVAPRDVLAGQEWGESILEAIKGARVMVLLLSANANESPHIRREVERAVSLGIPVITFRIENVIPAKSLELFVTSSHWLDAFNPPLERHLRFLAQITQKILLGPQKTTRTAVNIPPPSPEFVTEVIQDTAPPSDFSLRTQVETSQEKSFWEWIKTIGHVITVIANVVVYITLAVLVIFGIRFYYKSDYYKEMSHQADSKQTSQNIDHPSAAPTSK